METFKLGFFKCFSYLFFFNHLAPHSWKAESKLVCFFLQTVICTWSQVRCFMFGGVQGLTASTRPHCLLVFFAPAAAPPCTCSSHRGWCGVGPPGRKYKPLSFRCLADESCGGPAAHHIRHVPPTPQWGVFLVGIHSFASDWWFLFTGMGCVLIECSWLNRVGLVGRVGPPLHGQEVFVVGAWGWTEFVWHVGSSGLLLLLRINSLQSSC